MSAVPEGASRFRLEVINVTPEMAQEWFDNRAVNRKVKTDAVLRYAADMADDRWDLNGETIKINPQGQLVDGQNRMAAIIYAKVTVRMSVAFGVTAEANLTVDVGVHRQFADWLFFDQERRNTAVLGAVTARMYRWDELGHRLIGGSSSRTTYSQQDLARYFLDHASELDAATALTEGQVVHTMMPKSLFAAIAVILTRVDDEGASYFLNKVSTGAGLGERDPILLLRNRLLGDRRSIVRAKGYEKVNVYNVILALTFIGWNHYRDGWEGNKLQLPAKGLAEAFPYPR